jgi:hypothetical protein
MGFRRNYLNKICTAAFFALILQTQTGNKTPQATRTPMKAGTAGRVSRSAENIEILLQDKAAKVVLEYRDKEKVPSTRLLNNKGILNRQI